MFEKFKEGLREGWSYDPTPSPPPPQSNGEWTRLMKAMEDQGKRGYEHARAYREPPPDDVMVDIATDALARANDGMAAMGVLIDQQLNQIANLNRQLDFERNRVADLAVKLQAAETAASTTNVFEAGPATWAYEILGFTPGVPDFAIKAVRKACRKEYHPEGRSSK